MQLQTAQNVYGDGQRRKARLEKMVATAQLMLALIIGVVDVGVVLYLTGAAPPVRLVRPWQDHFFSIMGVAVN